MEQQALLKINEWDSLKSQADFYRLDANRKLDPKTKSSKGQFMTPELIVSFMASLFRDMGNHISLLDPGAGVGSLTAGFVEEVYKRNIKPKIIEVDAFEIESILIGYLKSTLNECYQKCKNKDIQFSGKILSDDFIKFGSDELWGIGGLFKKQNKQYTHCIMNPPYKKIRSVSKHRSWLRSIGVETSNLYSGFLAIAIKMLSKNGELVAIVPRSFCNGVYFKPFRKILLNEMSLKHIHVFESRKEMFKDDDVLQENIIFYAVKGEVQKEVIITSSCGANFADMTQREVSFNKIVPPTDSDKTIHLAISDFDQMVADRMSLFTHSLTDLNLEVCTGPVVDFRLIKDIVKLPLKGTFPLIYPAHFTNNFVDWPKIENKKPNAIKKTEKNKHWLMLNGWYVLTKRFSSKEERRRIVAAINDPNIVSGKLIGFENHLNVFHSKKHGLDPLVARGLALYLNSSLVDLYFRQFSGHTQVNATDLRMLRYPDLSTINRLGEYVKSTFPGQDEIDELLEKEISKMAKKISISPIKIKKKIQEALSILEELKLPKGQRNERSALTLLALLDIKPNGKWNDSGNPLMGITPIMDFSKNYYGKAYAPNTRETFRRQTMHQFVEAGIALPNPDDPDRPINSPKWVYQIESNILILLKSFGTNKWKLQLKSYFKKHKSLVERYAKKRDMQMIPVVINGSEVLSLTPGAHNQLIKNILEEFASRYAPGAEVLYVGDTGVKMGYFDKNIFQELGLSFNSHGKFPDVVLYLRRKNWLLLIESVASHGPMDSKRHLELSSLFSESTAGIVYVTAFPDRPTMAKYLSDISWETEVWIADSPSHLIHFNGERFLGPHEVG